MAVEPDAELQDAHRLVGGVGEEGVDEARGVGEGGDLAVRKEELWWCLVRSWRVAAGDIVLVAIDPLEEEGCGVARCPFVAWWVAWKENVGDERDVARRGNPRFAFSVEMDGFG